MLALRVICLWPGLPAAWLLGVARGLIVALVFTWCVCGLLLATFVWPAWISVGVLRLLWLVAFSTWVVTSFRNFFTLASLLESSNSQSAEALVTAQREYLAGNYFEAEAQLLEILHQYPRDAEALLLLVSVLRRTKRWQAALRRLGQMELMSTAVRWQFEMNREKYLIEREMPPEVTDQLPQPGESCEEESGDSHERCEDSPMNKVSNQAVTHES